MSGGVRSLSPSRAGDFMTCPLLFRFRTIDRLPERPSDAAVRGTVVHRVLELLFDEPPAERTHDTAVSLLPRAWESVLEESPEVAVLFGDDTAWQAVLDGAEPPPVPPDAVTQWLRPCHDLLATYFTMEDPRRLEPAEREVHVEVALESGLALRGFVDRVDVMASTGDMRVVDYKTGRSPREAFEQKALFQMRFYALVLWRMHGRVPRLLKLMYLGDGQHLTYEPDEADLLATERKLEALRAAIDRAEREGDWRPNPSRLCDWCSHRSICPAWGGTPPPLPAGADGAPVDAEEVPSDVLG